MRALPMASLLALAALTGCEKPAPELRAADILADPARFEKQAVELTGEVADALGIFSMGMYTLADPSGEIRVMTSGGLPAKGTKLRVQGTVSSGVTFGGKHYGVALKEARRAYLDEPAP